MGGVGEDRLGLPKQAARLMQHLVAHPHEDVADVGWSLAGRSVFEHRAVVLGTDRERLLSGLGSWPTTTREPRWCAAAHGPPARRCSSFPAKARNGSAWASNYSTPHRFSHSKSTTVRMRSRSSWTGR
ncbi:tautomycetin biosynthetic PKS domain protein [Mycobacterium xenopi 4042]|uniref:Tautomycetin biosynthetic PKS domain protein n=1 Tax=Mycobacterium xenopi 4042 TaxID=1299334 RepID=X8BG86_MYCXE|nr:tautomycetin biosynthetic PKS domain protein [Mycobacterium xenopi 4042]